MLIAPENIETNKLVKRKKFNFDTSNRMFGNLVILATDDVADYGEVFNSKLFKPQQMMAAYAPRRFRPMNKKYVQMVQKETYAEIRQATNGFLKIGKAMLPSYAGRNLAYYMTPEYNQTLEMVQHLKKGPGVHLYMQLYLKDMVKRIVDELGYEKSYVIFPMTKAIGGLRHEIMVNNSENASPLVEFLRTLHHQTFSAEDWKGVSRIIFYNPNANAMVVMDPSDPEIVDKFGNYLIKIIRLNNFNTREDDLNDIPDDDGVPADATEEDQIENTKDKIKDIVLRDVSKTLKANLDDYDDADEKGKAVITAIDRKVDEFLKKPENTEKSFSELVNSVKTDKDVTTNAIEYVESKKIEAKQMKQMEKNLERETEIIDSIADLQTDADQMVEPAEINKNIPSMVNPTVRKSSLKTLDEKYNAEQANIDLMNNLTAFSEQPYLPVTLADFKREDTSDDFTYKDTLTVKWKTDEGKTLTFKIDVPKVYNGHYIKYAGNEYVIQKQICRLPIVKTKDNRVEIATNFNKITCERTNGRTSRRNAALKKMLSEYKANPAYHIEYGYNAGVNSGYKNDFEFEETSTFLSLLKSSQYLISTNRPDVEAEFALLPYPESFKITDDMTPIGFELKGESKELLYIEDGAIFKAALSANEVSIERVGDTMYSFIATNVFHDDPNRIRDIGKSYIYSNAKFLTVKFPILVLCGIVTGLATILKKMKTKYRVSDVRMKNDSNWVEVKFQDKWLYYEDTTENSMLLNILMSMHTEDWNIADFNTAAPYVDYAVNTLGQPRFVEQTVKINISKMIDPITRDVLTHFKLPTDIVDLLLMANKMLCNNSFIPIGDMCNYRIRGNEQINAMLYQIIAEAYMKYQNAKLNGSNKDTIKIPQNALMAMVISTQNIKIAAALNPMLEMESSACCSMAGFKGVNLKDAYTLDLRMYNKSMRGVLAANATPFSGSVGTQRSLTVNPNINHVRGYMPTSDLNSLDSSNMMAATEMMSFTTPTRSDPPRTAMESGQTKHGVPTYVAHRQLIGSGYDSVVPYMLSDNFCFKAKKSGKVASIDDKLHLVMLDYDDGTHDAIDISEKLSKNTNSGFYINQKYVVKYKVGERFNEGDVITLNPSFFQGKGSDVEYMPGCLAKICVTGGDFVFEDSTYISEKLSEKCASDITMDKAVALGPNAIIHKIVNVGDHIEINQPLMQFTTSFNDPTTTEFLQDLIDTMGEDDAKALGNEEVLAKYQGRISDISIYYNVPFETLSPSLQELITNYNKGIEARRDALIKNGVRPSEINLKPTQQQKTNKIFGTEFEGVLIIFYITHKDKMSIGDKLTYSVALKGVVSKVSPESEAPISEFRPNCKIEGAEAASGIPKRMTCDVWMQLYSNKLLIELGRWVHEEWKK